MIRIRVFRQSSRNAGMKVANVFTICAAGPYHLTDEILSRPGYTFPTVKR